MSFWEDERCEYCNGPIAEQRVDVPRKVKGKYVLPRFGVKAALSLSLGHMPEIELTSPTTATGIWAMFDIVQSPRLNFRGYGHYEEAYVKQDGTWRIKHLLLTRLHCDVMQESIESIQLF